MAQTTRERKHVYERDDSITAVIERLADDSPGLPGAPRSKVEARVGRERVEEAIRIGTVYEVGEELKIARIYP